VTQPSYPTPKNRPSGAKYPGGGLSSPHQQFVERRCPLNAVRLLPLLGAFVLLGVDVPKAGAQEQPIDDSGKLRVVKFRYDAPQPGRLDVAVFKYPEIPGPPAGLNYVKRLVGLPGETLIIRDGAVVKIPGQVIERITIEGGKVEISGDTIKIKGGRVEIIRQPRQ